MLKRVLSLAVTTLLVSSLTLVSYGDAIKKALSDAEIADAIKVEQPTAKMIKVDSLPISGTVTTQGVGVTMTLVKLEGKPAIDSAETLMWPKVPANLITKNFDSDKDKAVVKKFEKAYADRVKAGIDYESAADALDKAKKDSKTSAAKLKDLKDALAAADKNLSDALADYKDASVSFSAIMQTVIFEDVAIGSKQPIFNKTVKDVDPGFYQLWFKRTDTNAIVKVYGFEVKMADDLKNLEIPSVVKPSEGTGKK